MVRLCSGIRQVISDLISLLKDNIGLIIHTNSLSKRVRMKYHD